MAFAIYGETSGYVHLVAGDCEQAIVSQFVTDVESVGAKLKDVYNVFAVTGRDENVDLEDRVNKLIEEAQSAAAVQ